MWRAPRSWHTAIGTAHRYRLGTPGHKLREESITISSTDTLCGAQLGARLGAPSPHVYSGWWFEARWS
ncbi:hypothetical protein RRG08_058751 [Elysia crispata]|uniref:Uncharacterized protein n=1 Tax=Elysia crispata TaxID=231223 RepID=A0AAE0YXJ1_9GAST|nr:hypothetical protein RRG08_058751 [Elysia crispata]